MADLQSGSSDAVVSGSVYSHTSSEAVAPAELLGQRALLLCD